MERRRRTGSHQPTQTCLEQLCISLQLPPTFPHWSFCHLLQNQYMFPFMLPRPVPGHLTLTVTSSERNPDFFFFFLCTVNFIIRHIKRVVTYWLAEQLLWLWEAIVKKVEAPTYFIHPCMYSTFAGTTKANARRSLALCFPSEETGKLAASISDVKHFLTEKGGASCC